VGFLVNPENQDLLLEIEDVARSTGQFLEVAKALILPSLFLPPLE